MKKIILISISILLSMSAQAAGTFQLEGKIQNFSQDKIEINDGYKIYSLQRNELAFAQQKDLKKLKLGSKVHLTVPFKSVIRVRAPASAK